ncbi:MAG: hypothetical protein V4736_13830 [Bdellovibrionota bacterium]
MKLLSLVFAVLVSASVSQAAPVLKNLHCAANNGVVIVTLNSAPTGVNVAASYGLLSRPFLAELSSVDEAGLATLTLRNPYALEYKLLVSLDVTSVKSQEAKGRLQAVVNAKPEVLADVVCRVELK